MDQIAKESGMSVGHIYRYFTNKREIITAIAQQSSDEILEKVRSLRIDSPTLKQMLIESLERGVMEVSNPEKAALMLEVHAEAARSPDIRAKLFGADVEVTEHLSEVIRVAVGRPLEPEDLAARVEMFHLIFQGIGLRTVMNPNIDRRSLVKLVIITIDAILA
jgi:AcrR family transcriptional regulator